MKIRLLLSVLLLLAFSSVADAGIISDLAASPGTNGVTLTWVSGDETGVASYLIERTSSTDGSSFTVVTRVAVKGSGSSYTYLDETAFRTTDNSFYRYRVTPLDASGSAVNSGQYVYYTQVLQNRLSSVRRTWGSIKAMFR